jgi:4-amino-4-deoxy-L-arabinose transferase-like glycosyltransferase
MNTSARYPWQRTAILVLITLLIIRLLLMWYLPLTDTTEARYAEIARKMLETGNWVTLLHDYGVPFWAKPPLSIWLSAASMGLFGVNEVAARLPALLLSLATLWLVVDLARLHMGRSAALACALLLAGSLLFFGAAGTVMTDPALLFCVTLSQVAFWHALVRRSRLWSYLLFVGLGLGLLAKGPLALVLTGLPIFFWVLLRNQWLNLWQRLPWIVGSLLMLAIALPWYILAEQRTPGFLNYFIMGEHFSRFLDPGWNGDKYGFAHKTAHGMIWLFAILALLPWSLLAPFWAWRKRRELRQMPAQTDGWLLYLSLWTLMTLLFFSLSGNIIFPYPLPMLPGCALLMATLWQRTRAADAHSYLPQLALLVALLSTVFMLVNALHPERYLRTQKTVIAAWQADHPAADSSLVYWGSRREFSAEFYSGGRVRTSDDPVKIEQLLSGPAQDYLLLSEKTLQRMSATLLPRLEEVSRQRLLNDTLLLLRERSAKTSRQPLTELP